ncbi:hypothetical protein U1Q18_028951 [Sarracenia purpurea var. burkii]
MNKQDSRRFESRRIRRKLFSSLTPNPILFGARSVEFKHKRIIIHHILSENGSLCIFDAMDVEVEKEIIGVDIKKEIVEQNEFPETKRTSTPASVIDVDSTDSESDSNDSDDSEIERILRKKRKLECVLPVGFLDPIGPEERMMIQPKSVVAGNRDYSPSSEASALLPNTEEPLWVVEKAVITPQSSVAVHKSCKQFWKAGDYEGDNAGDFAPDSVGMDHVRVHPRFLHSNATSHKWALGALAELLDNALDEVCNGATYVHVDMLKNKKDKNKMLLVEEEWHTVCSLPPVNAST